MRAKLLNPGLKECAQCKSGETESKIREFIAGSCREDSRKTNGQQNEKAVAGAAQLKRAQLCALNAFTFSNRRQE